MSTDLSADISNQVYVKKIVKSDKEFCIICSYPTKICLYKKNFLKLKEKVYSDWFYVCQDHLLSSELLEPQTPKEITDLENEIIALKVKLKSSNQELSNDSETWIGSAMTNTASFISNNILSRSRKDEQNGKKSDEESEENTDDASKETGEKLSKIKVVEKTKKQEISDILNDLEARKEQLEFLKKQIKYFKLDSTNYRIRLDKMISALSRDTKTSDKSTVSTGNTVSTAPKSAGIKFPTVPTHTPV